MHELVLGTSSHVVCTRVQYLPRRTLFFFFAVFGFTCKSANSTEGLQRLTHNCDASETNKLKGLVGRHKSCSYDGAPTTRGARFRKRHTSPVRAVKCIRTNYARTHNQHAAQADKLWRVVDMRVLAASSVLHCIEQARVRSEQQGETSEKRCTHLHGALLCAHTPLHASCPIPYILV